MGTLFWNVNFIDSQNPKLSIFARLTCKYRCEWYFVKCYCQC